MNVLRLTVLIILAATITACAPAPHPGIGNSLITGERQPVVAGVAQWQVLAAATANEIKDCLAGRKPGRCMAESDELSKKPIYIGGTEISSAFGRAFQDMLVEQLLARNIMVTGDPANAIMVSTVTHMVDRSGKLPMGDFPGAGAAFAGGLVLVNYTTAGLAALGGAVDYFQYRNAYGNGPQVVVTTGLSVEGRGIMRRVAGFYIPDTDRTQYASNSPWGLAPVVPNRSKTPLPVTTFKIVKD